MADDLVQRLAGVSLFKGLERARLGSLAPIVSVRRMQQGEVLFQEGEPATGLFAVLAGRVKVYKSTEEGKEQILRVWDAGEIFGEAPALWGGYFPASAACVESGELLWIPRNRLIEAIEKDPELAMALLAAMSRRLHHLTGLVEELALKEVPARLAGYLLGLPARPGEGGAVVELSIPKSQLAATIGTIPETLSRVLSRLAREGLVEAESSRRLRLRDVEGLEDLASGRRRLR